MVIMHSMHTVQILNDTYFLITCLIDSYIDIAWTQWLHWSSAVKINIFETNTLLLNIVAIVLASVIVHTKFMLSCSCDVPSLWSQPMMLILVLWLWYFLHNVQIDYILLNLLCCVVSDIMFYIIFCKRHF